MQVHQHHSTNPMLRNESQISHQSQSRQIQRNKSTQNHAIKEELIKQMGDVFKSRQNMISYYIAYDFPDRQRALKSWWEELIQKIIKKKQQIYVTFKDLQNITHINSLRPVPLKAVLKQLKNQSVFVREQDLTEQKRPPPPPKPWYTSIFTLAWTKPTHIEPQWPFTFSPDQKIICYRIKQQKRRQLTFFLQKQFAHQNSRFMRDFIQEIAKAIEVDDVSVELLLKEMHRLREVYVGEVEGVGDQVIIYSTDRKKMLDEMFIRVEKMKCVLKWQMHKLEILDDRSSAKIANLRQKAKQSLKIDDKVKGKVLVAQAVAQNNHREKIQVRIQVFQQKISQIQINQMNKSSIDLLKQAQSVYEEIAVDSQKFDQVMQKERELQMESDNTARKFQELAASEDVDEEVDRMMREIQQDSKQKERIEKKNVFVNLPSEKKQVNRLPSLLD